MRDLRLFADREEAGRILAARLREYSDRPDVIVLGLPRGGVPVAFEVAQALGAPLDVYLVRKLGVPGREELAMGAIASGGVTVLNDEVISALRIPDWRIAEVAAREKIELQRRETLYRGERGPLHLAGKTVILVDDGLATGTTMKAAIAAIDRLDPARVVVAVPTASPLTRDEIRERVDDCICVMTPEPFHAVGLWYNDFSQTTDAEVRELLNRANHHPRVVVGAGQE